METVVTYKVNENIKKYDFDLYYTFKWKVKGNVLHMLFCILLLVQV